MKPSLAILAALVLLGACAVSEGPPPPRGRINIFISPAGEPFVGGRDDAYPVGRWFARADANHDGQLSQAEFEADAKTFFDRLDANHDGTIDGFELGDYEQKIAPQILPQVGRLTARDIPPLPDSGAGERNAERMDRPVDRPGGRGLTGAASYGLTPEPEPVASADTDFDGKVTLAEFMAAVRRRFARLDLDHNGRLTLSELPPTPAQRLADKAAAKSPPERRNEHRREHR